MPYKGDNMEAAERKLRWHGDVETNAQLREQVRMLGGSGRIADIIGKVGYRKLIEEVEKTTLRPNIPWDWHKENAIRNVKMLHEFTGLLVKLNECEVELVGDCCGAPVEEHRPEHTHARCTACGEMALIERDGE